MGSAGGAGGARRRPPRLLARRLRQDDVVDGDVDELDEEANEAHDQEPHAGGHGNARELCGTTATATATMAAAAAAATVTVIARSLGVSACAVLCAHAAGALGHNSRKKRARQASMPTRTPLRAPACDRRRTHRGDPASCSGAAGAGCSWQTPSAAPPPSCSRRSSCGKVWRGARASGGGREGRTAEGTTRAHTAKQRKVRFPHTKPSIGGCELAPLTPPNHQSPLSTHSFLLFCVSGACALSRDTQAGSFTMGACAPAHLPRACLTGAAMQ